MTSLVLGQLDPFAVEDPRALKKMTAQFDNQRFVLQQTTTNEQPPQKRRSVIPQPSREFRSTPSSSLSVANHTSHRKSSDGSSSDSSSTSQRRARSPNMTRTTTTPSQGTSRSIGSLPLVAPVLKLPLVEDKPRDSERKDDREKARERAKEKPRDRANSKMHQTSSKILRMTDDERPFTRDFKDLFSTLITSLPLSAHRVRFSKVEETFLSEEAITHLGSLKFSQSNRIPDPKNTSRWIVTTTTTTFSMAKEMARTVCQKFVDARLIESAEQKVYTSFPSKGAVWQMTPKGTAVLKRFCDRNGIEAKHIEPLIRRPQMQMVDLERNPDTDSLVQDKSTMEVIFRRFAGQDHANLKSSPQAADSDSVSEYSSGLIGVKMARERRINDVVYNYTFTGKAASDWLLDCCTTIDRRETYEICDLFIKYGLMEALVEDKAYKRTVIKPSSFQPTKLAIYTVTERGQRVTGWLSRSGSISSDDGQDAREKVKMPKDTNMNRLTAILKDPALRMLFKEHLKACLCEENLNFYFDAQDFILNYHYLENAGLLQKPESIRETLATAYGLYNSFLASGAPSELNIDHALRNKLDSRMTQTESDKQNSSCTLNSVVSLIKDASSSVFKLMATDSVPKFIREPRYQQILHEHDFDVNFSSRGHSTPASGSDASLDCRRPSVRRTDSSRSVADR